MAIGVQVVQTKRCVGDVDVRRVEPLAGRRAVRGSRATCHSGSPRAMPRRSGATHSTSRATRRSSASSSSSVRSALRVTRNKSARPMRMPGNSWPMFSMMRSRAGTKRFSADLEEAPAASWGPSRARCRSSPVLSSRTVTAMLRARGRDHGERMTRVDRERRQNRYTFSSNYLSNVSSPRRRGRGVHHFDAV